MKYLHTMVRVGDLEKSLHFYRDLLGLRELRRIDNEKGRFTLVFLAAPGDDAAQVELTWNWDPEQYTIGRAFGQRVLPQLRTCSLPHVHGRVPAAVPATPLGTGVRR